MYKFLFNKIHSLFVQQVPATGIGLFRLLYGLVTLQEIIFLLYFNHLIFDPIPYIDVEFPMIPFFLCLWGLSAFFYNHRLPLPTGPDLQLYFLDYFRSIHPNAKRF